MDDLQSKLSEIMSDPEAMKQVQSLGEMLGLSQKGSSNAAPSPPPKIQTEAKQSESAPAPVTSDIMSQLGALGGDAVSEISRIMPLLSSMKQEDEATRLLSALRPFLSGEKQKKLDDAKRMMRFLKVLPLLKGGGLF